MEIMARATAVFFFVWVVTRSIGKRQLSELTAFQLVLLITIGDLVQQGLTQDDRSVTGAFLAVGLEDGELDLGHVGDALAARFFQ